MKKQMLLVISVLLIPTVLTSGCITNPSSVSTDNKSIVIGVILPFSGSMTLVGDQSRAGMTLAQDEINSAGGIGGSNISLIFEDSKGLPQDGVTAFNKLADYSGASAIVSSLSSVSNSVAPLAAQRKIPMLAIITTDSGVANNEWSFMFYSTENEEITPVLFLINTTSPKKIGIIHQNDDFGAAMNRVLRAKFNGSVIEESFAPSESDFRSIITKVSAQRPDIIVVVGFNIQTINILRQARELGVNSTFVATSVLSFPDVIKSAGEAADGVYLGASVFYMEPSTTNVSSFRQKMSSAYPGKQINHYSANGYDAIMMIAKAMENGHASNDVKDSLTAMTDFDGVLGKVTNNGRKFSFRLYSAIIENGSIKYLG